MTKKGERVCNAYNHPPGCMCGWGGGGWYAGPMGIGGASSVWWRQLPQFSKEAVLAGIARGEDIEEKDERGYTALTWAAIQGQAEIVECALDHGAQINTKDNYGQAPLYFACVLRHSSVADLLEKRGADLAQRDWAERIFGEDLAWSKRVLVSKFVKGGDVDGLRKLLTSVPNVFSGAQTFSAVFEAVKVERADMIELLLSHGADASMPDERGITALMLAAIKGNEKIVDLLLLAGASPSAQDNYKRTAAYLAEANGHLKLAARLQPLTGEVSRG